MYRVDAHQHFWEYCQSDYPWINAEMSVLRQDWLPPALLPELRNQSIDACIAVQARSQSIETDYLLALADQHDWIVGVVGWLDLRASDVSQQLRGWHEKKRQKLRGFRHILQDESDAAAVMNNSSFQTGVKCIQSRGYVYEVLVKQHQLPAAILFCGKLDGHWLVLDHLGKPNIRNQDHANWRRQIQPLSDMPHVVCKLSGLVTEAEVVDCVIDAGEIRRYLDTALELFGSERLMFGSDWPVCLLSASYATVFQIIQDWAKQLSLTEQTAIWGGTAIRSYDLQSALSVTTTLDTTPWT